MQQSQGGGGAYNYNRANSSTNGSTSTASSAISRRRPHVWQDDMAEVKETFRRVARAKHRRGAYSAPDHTSPPRVTAPILSRNRRARVRCQVPSSGLEVPVKLLQEIQSNRSQSPFVSINHLQNVLGMCRRIRSQHSLTERRKNPHDPSVYPVYVRRPWSVSAGLYHKSQHVNPTSQHRPPVSPTSDPLPYVSPHAATHSVEAISQPHDVSPSIAATAHVSSHDWQLHRATTHVSPNSHVAARSSNFHLSPNRHVAPATSHFHVGPSTVSATPLYYRPARFKPLYDISNGVFPDTQIRKRASAASCLNQENVRSTYAKEKPSWTHYRQLISQHDSLEVQQEISPTLHAGHHANPEFSMHEGHRIPIHAGNLHYDNNLDAMESNNIPISTAPAGGASFAWNSPDNHECLIITKKPRTLRPSPMGFSESWPSSSTCFSKDHHQHLSDLQSHLKFIHGLDCNDLNSDRRPHSENDLNLHSASYFLERPPSRCMKRPLSSSSCWRNGSDFLGMKTANVDQSPLDFGFAADAWSANSSTSLQECSIFIPRDLNGNILKPRSGSGTMACSKSGASTTTLRLKQRYCPKSNAGYKSTSFAGALMDLSRRHRVAGQQRGIINKHADNHISGSKAGGAAKRGGLIHSGAGMKKKKPINFSSYSCLEELEGLSPSKWAKRLASDLMGTTSPYRASSKIRAVDLHIGKEMNKLAPAAGGAAAFNNALKLRVKFSSPSVQNPNEGCFRKEAQSLASTEMIPDLMLSWERDSGLLTGDPPALIIAASDVHDAGVIHDDEEPDQQLLEQVEDMLGASCSSSTSPSPISPSQASMSPMQCSPVRAVQCTNFSSKSSKGFPFSSSDQYWGVKEDSCRERSFLKENGCIQPLIGIISSQNHDQGQELDEAKGREEDIAPEEAAVEQEDEDAEKQEAMINGNEAVDENIVQAVYLKEEDWMEKQEEEIANNAEPLMNASSFINIHHNTALIEAMESNTTVDKEAEVLKGHAEDAEWGLEKLFQDSLDLNPTLRHIYDTMSYLNAARAGVSSHVDAFSGLQQTLS